MDARQIVLLQATMEKEPFLKAHGQKISTWKEIALELSTHNNFKRSGGVDWQGCRRQFEKLFEAHQRQAKTAPKRTGEEEDYDLKDQLLDDIAALGMYSAAETLCNRISRLKLTHSHCA